MTIIRRRFIVICVLVPNALMLTTATSGFSLWDLPFVRDTLVTTFKEALKSGPTTHLLMSLTPTVDWKPFSESLVEPEPQEEYDIDRGRWKLIKPTKPKFDLDNFVHSTLDGSPHLWVVIVAMGINQGRTMLTWVLVLSFVFGITLTILFCLACFRPLLKAVYQFEKDVIENLDLDSRPVWQWFVDRMRTSTHVVETEYGRIREADHVFLGVSAIADFPVLLSKRPSSPPAACVLKATAPAFVLIAAKGKAEKRTVTIGINDGNRAEITTGLTPDDTVIAESRSPLSAGQPVQATPIKVSK